MGQQRLPPDQRNQLNAGTTGHLGIASRIEGVSFTILSSSGADASVLSYLIIEPKE